MCGITGIYAFNELGRFNSVKLSQALDTLRHRGPDFADMSLHHFVNLGHTRLSIIDLSREANQPMKDESGRFTIVYNGEIYNYPSLKKDLEEKGYSFRTNCDTEILLKGYMHEKEQFLHRVNGFFACAIYDADTQELFLARDRLGIKPLLVYEDEDKLIFGSEMKALIRFGIPKELDYLSLKQFLQLNYIPGPNTILKNVRRIAPGHFLKIKKGQIIEQAYYQIPKPHPVHLAAVGSYEQQKKQLLEILEQSVQQRLIADVPLGAFLSGGIDSSVITALASRFTDKLNTFSIGYRDEAFFDETQYANLVAKKFNTQHTVFSLTNQDLYDHLFQVLDYIDEPFADSSALAVYILSKRTAQKVKVALSGDGADELFSGYNKHAAEFRARQGGFSAQVIKNLQPLWQKLPKSRNSFWGNKVRQLLRFAEGLDLSEKERYWRWAIFAQEQEVQNLLSESSRAQIQDALYQNRKEAILQHIHHYSGKSQEAFNEVLYTDMQLVLPGDMLTKVDMMSMANSLEVRVPFLDHHLVDFVMSLPAESKINSGMRKRILQDTFRDVLPKELYRRPKKGFEVPLLKWFRGELRGLIEDDLLKDEFIQEQGIFAVEEVKKMKNQLFSANPQDVHARIWGLIVFQYWWKKWFN